MRTAKCRLLHRHRIRSHCQCQTYCQWYLSYKMWRDLCQATLVPIRKPSMKHEREVLRKWNALQRSIIFNKLPAKSCPASCQACQPWTGSPVFMGLEPSGLADSAGQASSPAKNNPQEPPDPVLKREKWIIFNLQTLLSSVFSSLLSCVGLTLLSLACKSEVNFLKSM